MPHCVPGARCDQGAPGGFLGSRHARAAGLDRQRAGDASCRHGAERGAVLAARLLRPLGRLDRGAAPDHHLSAVSAAPDLILAGGDVLLHEGGWRVIRTDVTVKGGRVAAVGQPGTGERPGTGDGERGKRAILVRDCGGCLIIPGLIQAHVHLCQTLFRGMADDLRLEEWLARRIRPVEGAHTEETVYWSAMLGAAELWLGGTTAVLDM